jgi:hypothetical protein
MISDFMFSAFGWHRELSQRAQDEIKRRFPGLPVDKISGEAGYYVILRDAKQPSSAQAREALRRIQQKASRLNDALHPSGLGPLESFIEQTAAIRELPVELDDLRSALQHLEIACSKAIALIPEGRRRSSHERLVRVLANIFLEAGQAVNDRPKGAFCQVVSIVLGDVGEKPSDVRKLVQPVVRAVEISKKKTVAFSKRVC